jgi:hypothetical protein
MTTLEINTLMAHMVGIGSPAVQAQIRESLVAALYAIDAAPAQAAAVPEAVERGFDAYLCRAWGETDMTAAEIVRDWEGVRRFMVREWLGEEEATDHDGTNTLERFKADFDEHCEDRRGGAYVCAFEIGGVSVEPVCGFGLAAPEAGAGGSGVSDQGEA